MRNHDPYHIDKANRKRNIQRELLTSPYVEDILSFIKPGDIVCEIGCREGFTTTTLARAGAIVYTIDPWSNYDGYDEYVFEDSYERAMERLAEFGQQRVTVLKMKSSEALSLIPMCDLIWVDGNHKYEYVRFDVREYWKKVKPGGIFSGHDYNHKDVGRAVNEFVEELGLELTIGKQSWIIRK